jgi:hypothetical protein
VSTRVVIAPSWVRLGVLVLAVVVVAQSVAHAFAFLIDDTYDSNVDLNASNSLPDIVSTAAIVTAVLGAVALGRTRVVRRPAALMLALLLALVVVADLAHTGAESFSLSGVALVLGLAVAAALIWRVARAAPRHAARLLDAGLLCLIGSLAVSFLFHRVDGWLAVTRGDVLYELKVIVKQGLELAGWWLVALGLWSAAFPGELRAAKVDEQPLPSSS